MVDPKIFRGLILFARVTACVALVTGGIVAGCGGDSTSIEDSADASTDAAVDRSIPVDSTAACAASETRCSGACVDTTSSATNCGECGKSCGAGKVCVTGACATSCGAGTVACSGVCRDTQSDPSNCGVCGKTCAGGEVCSAGTCALTCGGGATQCGASCVDTKVDRANCGGCGNACPASLVCSAGVCTTFCGAGLTQCGGADAGADAGSGAAFCVDASNDRRNCGACGTTCAAGNVCSGGVCQVTCVAGQINCNGTCVDPKRDRLYCGATAGCGVADAGDAGTAGTPCAAGLVCTAGVCVVSCPGNEVDCTGKCIDPTNSRTNCGATAGCGAGGAGSAGTACAAGTVCGNGTCQVSCPGNQIDCAGSCVDPTSSRTNCGATLGCGTGDAGSPGTACAAGNVCGNGTCRVSCAGAQVDCGGACIDPATSRTNCGATVGCGVGGAGSAGIACSAGSVCSAGVCSVSCPASQVNCGGSCVLPATSNTNCGATAGCGAGGVGSAGTACAAGTLCSGGTCGATCASPLVVCAGACVDPRFDPNNCNACGTTCDATSACVNGACLPLARSKLMVCGGSSKNVATFVPSDLTLSVVSSCTPDATTLAILVTRYGGAGFNAAVLKAYVDAGGIVLTEYSISHLVWTAVFEATAQGARFGSCSDSAPTVVQRTPADPFWNANAFQAITLPQSGCGYDVAGFSGIVPLAGWTAGAVSIGYRNSGAGRVYAGYMLSHRR